MMSLWRLLIKPAKVILLGKLSDEALDCCGICKRKRVLISFLKRSLSDHLKIMTGGGYKQISPSSSGVPLIRWVILTLEFSQSEIKLINILQNRMLW